MRDLVVSLGASGVLQACLFVSGIIVARVLGPADRGRLALIIVLPEVAAQLSAVGVPSALTYFVAKDRPRWEAIVRQLGVVVLAQILVALVFSLVLRRLFVSGHARHATLFVGLAGPPSVLLQYYGLHVMQGVGELRLFNAYRVLPYFIYSAGVLVLWLAGAGLVGFTAAWLVAQVIAAGVILTHLVRRARRNSDRVEGAGARRGEILRFGMRGFAAQVSPVETFRVDTLVVAGLFPDKVVGYYAVANSLSNVPRFIADGLSAVAYPHVAEPDVAQGRPIARRYIALAAGLCGSAALVIGVLLPVLIPALFGDRFRPAVTVAEILIACAALVSVRRVALDCQRALGRPGAATLNEIGMLATFAVALVVVAHSIADGGGVALALTIASAAGLLGVLWSLRDGSDAARTQSASRAPE